MKKKLPIIALASTLAIGVVASLALLNANKAPLDEADEPDNVVYEEPYVKEVDKPDRKFIKPFLADDDDDEIPLPTKVKINYHNDDAICDTLAFYMWYDNGKGKTYAPDTVSADHKDMDITLDFNTPTYAGFKDLERMYFIIKPLGEEDWTGQSDDTTISYKEFPPDANGLTEVFVIKGEGSSLEVYATKEETQASRVLGLQFSKWKVLEAKCTVQPGSYKLYAFDKRYLQLDKKLQPAYTEKYLIKQGQEPAGSVKDGAFYFDINLLENARPNLRYYLEATFPKNTEKTRVMSKSATFERLYNTARWHKYYEYNGEDLGVNYNSRTTTIKVWAPTAYLVQFALYSGNVPTAIDKEKGSDSYTTYDMFYQRGGVWSVTLDKQLQGRYYNIYLVNSLGENIVVDPYAHACGVNGLRGMIADFSKTNPEGWDNLPLKWDGVEGYDIKAPNDLSVYEVHVRDLTMHNTWTGSSKRGTFAAFSESGTSYSQDGKTVSTGFDHLVDLAPKAIQIVPFYDQANDELSDTFNWGYNPLNYNCLEGQYSTDPVDGYNRIKEFKNLVYKYATSKSKIRIIMDVVYNHVASLPQSNFNKLMPKYYFRYTKDWAPYNGSGCGNEVKTEAPMMSKFIVESLCFWAREYKIKGFRFDLMGLYDTDTLALAAEKLYKIDPDIVMYGEGWRGDGDSFHGRGKIDATTGNVYSHLYPTNNRVAVGAFNDRGRNALRGGNDPGWGASTHLPGWGYMQRKDDASADDRTAIADSLWGMYSESTGKNPHQTVNYASCHDNWTCFDQLYYTLGDGVNTAPGIKTVMDASLAANSFVQASNGIAFMLGGEEIFRSKTIPTKDLGEVAPSTYENMYGRYVSHNSYNAPDSVNAFDWSRKIKVDGVSADGYFEKFKAAFELHNNIVKKSYAEPFPNVAETSWAGTSGENYCCGFRFSNYYVCLAGRAGGTVGNIPSNATEMFKAGTANKSGSYVTLGAGSIAVYRA